MTTTYDPELIDRLVPILRRDARPAPLCPDCACSSCADCHCSMDHAQRDRARDAADQLEAARREVDAGNDKLRRLYNAMCGAMANWERPDPGDRNLSDAEWERVGKAQEAAWHEMKAVFDASPGVLYVDAYRAAKGKP